MPAPKTTQFEIGDDLSFLKGKTITKAKSNSELSSVELTFSDGTTLTIRGQQAGWLGIALKNGAI